MSYPKQNTDWAISKKGNTRKPKDGVGLVVGSFKNSKEYWARRGDDFVKGRFDTMESAMYAAEFGGEGDDKKFESDDERWEY